MVLWPIFYKDLQCWDLDPAYVCTVSRKRTFPKLIWRRKGFSLWEFHAQHVSHHNLSKPASPPVSSGCLHDKCAFHNFRPSTSWSHLVITLLQQYLNSLMSFFFPCSNFICRQCDYYILAIVQTFHAGFSDREIKNYKSAVKEQKFSMLASGSAVAAVSLCGIRDTAVCCKEPIRMFMLLINPRQLILLARCAHSPGGDGVNE